MTLTQRYCEYHFLNKNFSRFLKFCKKSPKIFFCKTLHTNWRTFLVVASEQYCGWRRGGETVWAVTIEPEWNPAYSTEQWQEKMGEKSFVAIPRKTEPITLISVSLEYATFILCKQWSQKVQRPRIQNNAELHYQNQKAESWESRTREFSDPAAENQWGENTVNQISSDRDPVPVNDRWNGDEPSRWWVQPVKSQWSFIGDWKRKTFENYRGMFNK